jgi:hypothetical protein
MCEEKSAIDLSHPNLKATVVSDSDVPHPILGPLLLPENVQFLF